MTDKQEIGELLDSAEGNIELVAILLRNPNALTLDECGPLLRETADVLVSLQKLKLGKEWRERLVELQVRINSLELLLHSARRFYVDITQAVGRVYAGYTPTGRTTDRYWANRISVDL